MNAIVYKNDEFRTIGVEIYDGKECVFRWGVTSETDWHKTKTIDFNTLYEIKKTYEDANFFHHDAISMFFGVVRDNKEKLVDPECGFKFEVYNTESERLMNKFVKLINLL